MYNFEFQNPTKILFGKGKIEGINALIPENATVLITYGGGSAKKNGVLDKAKTNLGKRKVIEFGGIEPNPRYETLMRAAEIVRNEGIDFILAVGGGSVLDGTKFICLASHYKGEAHTLLTEGRIAEKITGNVLPFGAVLTLPATGSEMNSGGVITYDHGKYAFSTPMTYPQFSVLDPTYTFTLPNIQVANGIVDAFIHTVEQYTTYPVDARVQDRMAEGILQTLIEIGETTVNEPENYDARANLMWSATMALNGLIGVGVPQDWATHIIGHELTALFGIDHGQTLAIVYPSLIDVCRNQKKEKLLQYAERIWNITQGDDNERIDQAIGKTRAFFESLGIKTRLSEYGITQDKIQDIVNALEKHGHTALSEKRSITLEVSRQILEKAF